MNEFKNAKDRRSYKRTKPNANAKLGKQLESNGYEKKLKVEWRPAKKNDNSPWNEVFLVDLSVAGAGIAADTQIEIGTSIALRFTAVNLPKDDNRPPSTAKGEVKNCTIINESYWRYGIEFEKLHFAFTQWTEVQ